NSGRRRRTSIVNATDFLKNLVNGDCLHAQIAAGMENKIEAIRIHGAIHFSGHFDPGRPAPTAPLGKREPLVGRSPNRGHCSLGLGGFLEGVISFRSEYGTVLLPTSSLG